MAAKAALDNVHFQHPTYIHDEMCATEETLVQAFLDNNVSLLEELQNSRKFHRLDPQITRLALKMKMNVSSISSISSAGKTNSSSSSSIVNASSKSFSNPNPKLSEKTDVVSPPKPPEQVNNITGTKKTFDFSSDDSDDCAGLG